MTFNQAKQVRAIRINSSPENGFDDALVACPSRNQCTAIVSAGGFGDAATFNPAKRRPHVTTPTVEASGNVIALACPSPVQCTAVDGNAEAVTFNPPTR
ncbi:MAG: hypothetical protein M3Z27_04755 [Actinomycetota bacterium]|nr:hypothetical protein [Actinomycetota bacterium]